MGDWGCSCLYTIIMMIMLFAFPPLGVIMLIGFVIMCKQNEAAEREYHTRRQARIDRGEDPDDY